MLANAPQRGAKQQYSREDVRRMLGVSERRLRSWERLDLIPPRDIFEFSDLIALKALQKLAENHIAPKQIGRAIDSLKNKLSHVDQPLTELRLLSDGKTISVLVAGQKMEAISGQLLFDFEANELTTLKAFPQKQQRSSVDPEEAEVWFQRGLHLEETGAPVEVAIEAYQRAIALNPNAAGALVNLGTIYYRQRKFADAEQHYRRALDADAAYPLAHFNLGNLHDERGETDQARQHYLQAVRLNPSYADAYFNLALLAERANDVLKAVAYWKSYLKLDGTSSWARTARRQLDKLRRATVLESK